MRILRSRDHRVMPWKNGRGATTEIAVFPDNAGMDAFDWRLSMAAVVEDGPFSNFQGVDRTLSVLTGAGITLRIAGREPNRLSRTSEPFSFPGDVAAHAILLDGPIRDLNVMTRRGRFKHKAIRRIVDASCIIETAADTTILLSRSPDLKLSLAGQTITLCEDDAVMMMRGDASPTIMPSTTVACFVVSLLGV